MAMLNNQKGIDRYQLAQLLTSGLNFAEDQIQAMLEEVASGPNGTSYNETRFVLGFGSGFMLAIWDLMALMANSDAKL